MGREGEGEGEEEMGKEGGRGRGRGRGRGEDGEKGRRGREVLHNVWSSSTTHVHLNMANTI